MMISLLILSLGGLWGIWTWVSWYLQGSGNRHRIREMRKARKEQGYREAAQVIASLPTASTHEEQEEENACRWIKAFHDAAVQRSAR